MAASVQDGDYYMTQNKCFQKLSDHRYCIKLKGSVHDHSLKCCGQALLVCKSGVKAQPGHTGAVRLSMGFSVCF